MYNFLLFVLLLHFYGPNPSPVDANTGDCNELVCGSIVSKCLITRSCQCELADCKECLLCLGALYLECCNCVEMCPKNNETYDKLMPKSLIGDFEGLPELFDTLTAEEDEDSWTTVRFPVRVGLQHRYDLSLSVGGFDDIDHQAALQKMPLAGINCTIIFLHECVNSQKCKEFCNSMGASSYRWFHDGCCECVGANCFNYGINEGRCAACPGLDEDDEDDDFLDDDGAWDYSEGGMSYT